MLLIYNLFIRLYFLGIKIASWFNTKAAQWINGRKNLLEKLQSQIDGKHPIIWMHCASLGEFEQGRPLLETIKRDYPHYKLLITFFSPSGYEIRKNYADADWIYYLPIDTKSNATRFINIVKPKLVIFVKYEFWYHYLNELHQQKIPILLISAIFRKESIFFKAYGGFYRKILTFFTHIFVQDDNSITLLKGLLPKDKVSIAGDTRFDRVVEIANSFSPIPEIAQFTKDKIVIVAGSTWPADEGNIKKAVEKIPSLTLIIAPHEIDDAHIKNLESLFTDSIKFSAIKNGTAQDWSNKHVLIIDNIGMLSRLYYYATICYIGGGFNKSGIHNTLEAAVYGKPVIFGPYYKKFKEAVDLIKINGGISYSNENELFEILLNLKNDNIKLKALSIAAGNFVKNSIGATRIIISFINKILKET